MLPSLTTKTINFVKNLTFDGRFIYDVTVYKIFPPFSSWTLTREPTINS